MDIIHYAKFFVPYPHGSIWHTKNSISNCSIIIRKINGKMAVKNKASRMKIWTKQNKPAIE